MKSEKSRIWFASLILFVNVFGVLSSQPVLAQELKSTVQEMVAEEEWLSALHDLEFGVQDLIFHHGSAILASYGDYNSHERADGSSSGTDLTRFKVRITMHQERLPDFKRAIRHFTSLPEEDAKRAENIMLLDREFQIAAGNVAALLDNGDHDAANLAYRDGSVPLSKKIGGELYTLQRASQDRFSGIAKNLP